MQFDFLSKLWPRASHQPVPTPSPVLKPEPKPAATPAPAPCATRGPTQKVIVGPRGHFSDEQLAGFGRHVLEAPRGFWLLVFEGDGYRDVDQVGFAESAKRMVGHFKCMFPDASVEWLVEQ